jgi:hypothetical protein
VRRRSSGVAGVGVAGVGSDSFLGVGVTTGGHTVAAGPSATFTVVFVSTSGGLGWLGDAGGIASPGRTAADRASMPKSARSRVHARAPLREPADEQMTDSRCEGGEQGCEDS